MSDKKNKKQFGVWMDNHHATVVGTGNEENAGFEVLAHIKNPGADNNSNEHAANNQETGLRTKFFKEIAATMQNVDEIHVTGTGQSQEQFIKFFAETPQYKNVVASESTSEKMSDEHLVAFVKNHFN